MFMYMFDKCEASYGVTTPKGNPTYMSNQTYGSLDSINPKHILHTYL